MLLRTKIAVGFVATAVAAAGAVTATQVRRTTETVVGGTAYADETHDGGSSSWFEPSGALVPKGTCGNADDRLVVRTDGLYYRDGATDPGPHAVPVPRPAGTARLGTDSQLARLKDGRLLYLESGRTSKPYDPPPGWEDFDDWSRSTFELYVSECGTTFSHALTIDTKDVDGGRCAWPQQKGDGTPWPGGFDRAELYVDPYGGDVYVSTACRGGTADDYADEHLYRRMLLLRVAPDVSSWTLTKGVQLNYGVPLAVTSTADGSVYLLRCDYERRPQLLRLADRGERLVSVSDVQHDGEATAAARCARDWDISEKAAGMTVKAPELRLAPAGPRAVRLAYQHLFDGRPQLRYYTASFGPLPAGSPCAAVRAAYLGDLAVPDDGNLPPVPECGARPAYSKAKRLYGTDNASIVHFDLIAPDATALGSPGAMASSLLYWMEHSPETGLREVRYVTIGASGGWSARRTVSAAPWRPKIPAGSRDADYEYGGYAFVDGRCRYALVWNESHVSPAGDNLYAHWAIVDDLACTGTVAPPSPTASPSVTPSVTSTVTTAPPATAPPSSSAPPSAPATTPPVTSSASPTAAPAFAVTSAALSVQQCTQQQGGTWRCPYSATFTFAPGKGGTFSWRVRGTLKHDCYPSQGGAATPYAQPPRTTTVSTGQQQTTVSGFLTFAQAPNPADVYGNPGQASTAYVAVTGGPTSETEEFYSNAICGKP